MFWLDKEAVKMLKMTWKTWKKPEIQLEKLSGHPVGDKFMNNITWRTGL